MAPCLMLAFLGDELLQGFDEGIRIAQRLGDGFLFGFGGREGKLECLPSPIFCVWTCAEHRAPFTSMKVVSCLSSVIEGTPCSLQIA